MKKKAYLLWLLAAVLLLCACGQPGRVTVPSYTAPTEQTTVPTDTAPTEQTTAPATTMPTETTAPLHTPLYLPDCTVEEVLVYFEEVALRMEYTDGTGDATLVQKWTGPIHYRIYGTPTGEDLAALEALCVQLNAVAGFPGIYPASEDRPENLSLRFLDPEAFSDAFSEAINGETAFGAAQFWYYTDTNEIYTARIGCRTDIDQAVRTSVLTEEIVNVLGISDTQMRTDSIVYQYSDENTELSEIDWLILKLLYDPQIQCGMDFAQCSQMIQQLYF